MSFPYRYAPGVEVSGTVMSAIFNHYRRDEVLESLQKHHLDYFDADQWYPVDQFLRLLNEWSHMPSFMTNLISVGMAMIYHLDVPDEIERLDPVAKLCLLGDLHTTAHRHGDAGHYAVEQVANRVIRYTENMVWPDDMIYGYIYGAAQHFLGQGIHFTLRYLDGHQHQNDGGDSTLLELAWEEEP